MTVEELQRSTSVNKVFYGRVEKKPLEVLFVVFPSPSLGNCKHVKEGAIKHNTQNLADGGKLQLHVNMVKQAVRILFEKQSW